MKTPAERKQALHARADALRAEIDSDEMRTLLVSAERRRVKVLLREVDFTATSARLDADDKVLEVILFRAHATLWAVETAIRHRRHLISLGHQRSALANPKGT